MAKDLCAIGAVDDAKYSSPLPVIGLYITGATLVCFLSMVCDVWYGLRGRKPWIPCRFFSLNSLTLTLLSISTKLPVDLTTKMPMAQDQLSKLSGTALICISMGFFMPSLGSMGESEGLANMASLSILVVAVVVNVCMQMATGVIFSFIIEHLIILFCMLVLLGVLWYSFFSINSEKSICTNRTKELLLKGHQGKSSESNMLDRLKLCYVHSYSSDPQLILFQTSHCATIGVLCTLCSLVLLEAVLRSFGLEELMFCKGVSDYRWSMKIVVVTQILTVLVGGVATSFRWLTFYKHLDEGTHLASPPVLLRTLGYQLEILKLNYLGFRFYKKDFKRIIFLFIILLEFVMVLIIGLLYVTSVLVVWSSLKVRERLAWTMRKTKNCWGIFMYKHRDAGAMNSITEEFQDVFHPVEKGLKEWILRIGVENMGRWMKVNKKTDFPNLIKLLLKTTPSQESIVNDIQRLGQRYKPTKEVEVLFGACNYRVSCLSIVVLVLLANVLISPSFGRSLKSTLNEAFYIISFIDKRINNVGLYDEQLQWNARSVWRVMDIIIRWFQKTIKKGSPMENHAMVLDAVSQFQTEFKCALPCISKLEEVNPFEYIVTREMKVINECIYLCKYESSKELYDRIEQIFVDILHFFLTNLPHAIFKFVNESPAEEREERVGDAIKLLHKLKSLEEKIQWSFPDGSNIISLSTRAPTEATDTNDSTQVEGGADTVTLSTEDVDDIVVTNNDEIIEEINV